MADGWRRAHRFGTDIYYYWNGPHPHREIWPAKGGGWELWLETPGGMGMNLHSHHRTKREAQMVASALTLEDRKNG